MGRAFLTGLVVSAVLTLASCSPQVRTHGYVPTEAQLQDILPGVDSRASVEEKIGVPTTSGFADEGAFYYIQSTMSSFAWRAPQVMERTVIEIVFDDDDVVANISVYGLEDGRIIRLSRRVTRSGDGNIGFIRQLFGNIGGISAEQILGGE